KGRGPPPIVEGGGREGLHAVEDGGDAEVPVAVARIADRELAEEAACVAVVVLRVDAHEGDSPAETGRQPLEEGELPAAGPAPRRPLVHNDGVAAELPESLLEGAGAATQQLVGLAVEGRKGCGRAGKRARAGLPGALWLARAARRERQSAHHDQA